MTFSLQHLRTDFLAGIVVFLVSLPLCLGIASASGVDALPGLMAGIIGGLVVALFSASPLSVSGPAAGLVVVVIHAVGTLGDFSTFLVALGLAGVLQFVFGLLRVGRFAAYVPSTVISGLLAAIGVLLIIKQVPLALDLPAGAGTAAAEAVGAGPAWASPVGPFSLACIVVSSVSLVILALWDRPAFKRFAIVRALPAPLVVVLWGIAFSLLADRGLAVLPPEGRVMLPSFDSLAAFAAGLARPDLANLGAYLRDPVVWRVALTLAVVASLESLLNLEAVDRIDPQRRVTPADRELRAQGIGNLCAGLLGALPVTSVIVRSAANVQAGARSRVSAMVHGALLLVSVFLLADMLSLVPLSCLAAILIHTGFKLAKPSMVVAIWRQGPERFLPFAVTVVTIVCSDLLDGIAAGLACSLLLLIRSSYHAALSLTQLGDVYLLRLHKDIHFLSKARLKRYLRGVAANSSLIIDGSGATFIDADIRQIIDEFVGRAAERGIIVECRHIPESSRPLAKAI